MHRVLYKKLTKGKLQLMKTKWNVDFSVYSVIPELEV